MKEFQNLNYYDKNAIFGILKVILVVRSASLYRRQYLRGILYHLESHGNMKNIINSKDLGRKPKLVMWRRDETPQISMNPFENRAK